jgi:hypothetical protein
MSQKYLSCYFNLNRIARWAMAFFLFASTVELCARIDDKIKYGAPLFDKYSADILRETDLDGIRRNVPNSRFEKWRINEQGFRGESIESEKAPGVVRIACMGTSESFGLYEDSNMEWPAQLRAKLRDYGRFEIINASVVGLGIGEFIPYLRKYVLPLEPDIVILYVNPYFYFEMKFMESSKREDKPSSGKTTGSVSRKPKINVLGLLKLRSPSKVKQALKHVVPKEIIKRFQVWNLYRQVREIENSSLAGRNPLDVVPKEYLESFVFDMMHLVKFLKRSHIKVILSTYPSLVTQENVREHIEIFLDFRRFTPGLSLKGLIDVHNRFDEALRTVSEKSGAALVDNSRNVPSDIVYFGDNVHYTNRGASAVAKSFADFIVSKKALASSYEVNRALGR